MVLLFVRPTHPNASITRALIGVAANQALKRMAADASAKISTNAKDIIPVLINVSIRGGLISAPVSRAIKLETTRGPALMSMNAKNLLTNMFPTAITCVSVPVITLPAHSGVHVLTDITWQRIIGPVMVCITQLSL